MKELVYEFPKVQENSRKLGLKDGGTQQFKAGFMYHLTREAIQNIMDAALSNDLPAEAEFSVEDWDNSRFPGRAGLLSILKDCHDSQADDATIARFYPRAIKLLKEKTIPFLVIKDSNTRGLDGDDSQATSNYSRLIKSEGSSSKGSSSLGSYGLGKNAFYTASNFRCFFVSSAFKTNKNLSMSHVFQGCLKYSTFISKNTDGSEIWHVPDGFFGSPGLLAVRNESDIPKEFMRLTQGTSIYIPGFIGANEGWEEQIIRATLENFWLAIIKGRITVKIGSLYINKENIKSIIENKYSIDEDDTEDLRSNPLPQIMAYLGREGDEGWRLFSGEIAGLGEVQLIVLMNNAFCKRIHYYRGGMKIWKRNHKKLSSPYSGIFMCASRGKYDSISEREGILTKMENPAHDQWDPGNIEYDPELKKKASVILSEIDRFVKDSLGSIGIPISGEAVDLPDLPSFLSIDKQGAKKSDTGGLSGTPKIINIPKPVDVGLIIKRDPLPLPPPEPDFEIHSKLGKLLRDFPAPRAFAIADDVYRIVIRGKSGVRVALRLFSSSDNGFEKLTFMSVVGTETKNDCEFTGNLIRHIVLPDSGRLKIDVVVENSFMAPLFIQVYED